MLRCYDATMLRCYDATMLRCYDATMLRCYDATMLRCYDATMLRCYDATMLRCYDATMLRCYDANDATMPSIKTTLHAMPQDTLQVLRNRKQDDGTCSRLARCLPRCTSRSLHIMRFCVSRPNDEAVTACCLKSFVEGCGLITVNPSLYFDRCHGLI